MKRGTSRSARCSSWFCAAVAMHRAAPRHGAARPRRSTPTPSSGCQLGKRRQARDRHHVRQRALQPRQPERACPTSSRCRRSRTSSRATGTLLSNNHTPLIAHTADDTDHQLHRPVRRPARAGLTNDYETSTPSGGHRCRSRRSLLDGRTASTRSRNQTTRRPFRRRAAPDHAARTVGAVHARRLRRRRRVDREHGARERQPRPAERLRRELAGGRPAQRATPTRSRTRRPTTTSASRFTAHRATRSARHAQAVKFGQTTPSHTAVTDALPDEPGGYNGYQAVFGHKYLQPQLVAGAPTPAATGVVNGHTYPVADAAGNLIDLSGNGDQRRSTPHTPGFPGFGPISAAQSLAYMADMQESGVPVTYAYISDVHESKPGRSPAARDSRMRLQRPGRHLLLPDHSRRTTRRSRRSSSGSPTTGSHRSNTLFVFAADEGDHFAGANVGRAVDPPTCTGTPAHARATPAATRRARSATVRSSIHGLLAVRAQQHHPVLQRAAGQLGVHQRQPRPAPVDAAARARLREASRPTTRTTATAPRTIAQYEADRPVEQLLHFVNADPNRTPSFTVFPKPDFFFTIGTTDSSPAATGTTAATRRRTARRSTTASRGITATTRRRSTTRGSGSSVRASQQAASTARAGQGPSSAGSTRTPARDRHGGREPRDVGRPHRHPADAHGAHRSQGRLRRGRPRADRGSDDHAR